LAWFRQFNRKVLVETGTFRGQNIQNSLEDFELIYSVESDWELYLQSKRRFEGVPKVHIFHGDSVEFLEGLFLPEPAVFYLDAHWSGWGEPTPLPLLGELKTLSKRAHPDVIVIDDMRLMGKASWSGEDGTDWPRAYFDFTEASPEAISEACPGRWQWAEDIDRLIIHR
jgi:hypothetical protein